jgi:hypothetical protein
LRVFAVSSGWPSAFCSWRLPWEVRSISSFICSATFDPPAPRRHFARLCGTGSAIAAGYPNRTLASLLRFGCVDKRAVRPLLRIGTTNCNPVDYWLDVGNNADSVQFVLGKPLNETNRRSRLRLRTVAELYPEIADAEQDNDGLPSCSAAEALERQEPFVNSALAQHALALLARLFRYGNITYHGGFLNLSTGASGRLSVDPSIWSLIRRHSKGRMRLRASGRAA